MCVSGKATRQFCYALAPGVGRANEDPVMLDGVSSRQVMGFEKLSDQNVFFMLLACAYTFA